MISKGCTCKNTFSIPYSEDDIKAIYITYQQNKVTVIEKELSDCIFGDGVVSVLLSQTDTVKLNEDAMIRIQIRVKLVNNHVVKSNVIQTITDELLKGGEI